MKYTILALAAVIFVGCRGGSSVLTKDRALQQTLEHEMVKDDYLESIGIGAADATLTNQTQRKATSRNAAIVAAQYEMLSTVKGLNLEGGISVSRAIETDSNLHTVINAQIKGAEVVKTEWTNDDGCVVTMRLDKKRLEKMMGVKFK